MSFALSTPTRVHSQVRPALAVPTPHRLRIAFQEYDLPLGVPRVGRDAECRLSIDDASISRHHIEIIVTREGVTLRDLGSRNGTHVNGARIRGEVELQSEDRVRIGSQELVFLTKSARAPLRTTARLRRCDRCEASYVYDAPSCPHCGCVPPEGDWLTGEGVIHTPAEPQRPEDWWLDLHVEVVARAISLLRFDEAREGMQRIEKRLAEHDVDHFEVGHVDAALEVAIALATAQGESRWIAWALARLLDARRVPSDSLLARLEALPPILLVDVVRPLEAMVEQAGRLAEPPRRERLARLCEALESFRMTLEPPVR